MFDVSRSSKGGPERSVRKTVLQGGVPVNHRPIFKEAIRDTFAIDRGCLICREIYHRLIMDVFFPHVKSSAFLEEIQQLPCFFG